MTDATGGCGSPSVLTGRLTALFEVLDLARNFDEAFPTSPDLLGWELERNSEVLRLMFHLHMTPGDIFLVEERGRRLLRQLIDIKSPGHQALREGPDPRGPRPEEKN